MKINLPGWIADVTGQWRAEFDTQIRRQDYLFTFQVSDVKVTGTATAEVGGQKRELAFKEFNLAGDTLAFVELFKFQDNVVRIENSRYDSAQLVVR